MQSPPGISVQPLLLGWELKLSPKLELQAMEIILLVRWGCNSAQFPFAGCDVSLHTVNFINCKEFTKSLIKVLPRRAPEVPEAEVPFMFSECIK